jgi:ribonuclease HI
MPDWVHTLTVDASYDRGRGVVGIGIVIQERRSKSGRGRVIEQVAEAHRGIDPASAEEFGVVRALEIAIARGFTRIKVRSDYNALRRQIREQYRRRFEGADPTSDSGLRPAVLRLANVLEWVDFSYVRKRKNGGAHRLARVGRTHEPVEHENGNETDRRLTSACTRRRSVRS